MLFLLIKSAGTTGQGKVSVIIGSDPRSMVGRWFRLGNYEARKFGVHSAMSSLRKPMSSPGFLSREIMKISNSWFADLRDFRWPRRIKLSHEHDLCLSGCGGNKLGIKSAVKITADPVNDIWNELQLTAFLADVFIISFWAKIASDYEKPHGLTIILPEEAEGFFMSMDIAKFHGVGKKRFEKLYEMGVYTGGSARGKYRNDLIDKFNVGFDLTGKRVVSAIVRSSPIVACKSIGG